MERYNNQILKRVQKVGIDNREDVIIIFFGETIIAIILKFKLKIYLSIYQN